MKWVDLNERGWQWATLIFLALIWGSSFILMKRGLEVFTSVQVASLRMMVAGIALLPFALYQIRHLRGHFFAILLTGFIGNGIPAYLFTWSQMHVSSSAAGILNSLTPVFTLVAGALFFKTPVRGLQITGVVLGLAGSVLLFINKSFSFELSIFSWGLLIVAATAMYGYNSNHVKHKLKEVPGFVIAALSFLLILPLASIVMITHLPDPQVLEHEHFARAAIAVATLGVLGSALAVAVINVLIKYTSPVFAVMVTYLMPAVAMAWGFSDNESIGWSSFLALALILAGVYLTQLKQKHEKI